MADASRIFIRGLPPNMKEEEFKRHFSKVSSLTDAKLIPRRRIGYIGFESSDAATKAVRYYNKTFIRMSRILVELAKPVAELKAEEKRTPHQPTFVPSEELNGSRDKVDVPNPKLKEFLQVMQPPSQRNFWSNEETEKADTELDNSMAHGKSEGSDEEYEPVPKRRKTLPQPSTDRPQLRSLGDDRKALLEEPTSVGFVDTEFDKNEAAKRFSGPDAAPTSDADWLRLRTSRLLGLVDDAELAGSTKDEVPVSTISGGDDITFSEPERFQRNPDAGGMTKDDNVSNNLPAPAREEQAPTDIVDSSRLFVRNLPYRTSQEDLRQCLANYGLIEEVHISTDSRTGSSKGFAYVQFADQEAASRALQGLDGRSFQGRLLHVLPATPKKETALDDYAISKLPHKKQQQIRRKAEAASATFKWNSLYVNADAIMSSISDKLGVSKSEILDPTSSNAAVKQAHAETNIIQETKAYFASHGVNIDSFKKQDLSDTVVLVKNFAYGTTSEEIRQLFEAHGTVKKLLMPPSGTIAIVELDQPGQARAAFGALAYRKFKESVLFLEKAPKAVFDASIPAFSVTHAATVDNKLSATDLMEEAGTEEHNVSATLFVRNLNFSTTSVKLHDLFCPLKGYLSARVKTKSDAKKPGQVLSMGFGFVEFRSKEDAQAALATMNGYRLEGHDILIQASHKSLNAADERRNESKAKKIAQRRTKIIIKNLPFETTKRDIHELFGPYGKLRSVRVPKKFDSSTRGFAFADFITAKEAQNAMTALLGAHLLGRRLNLEFAAEDAIDAEEEIERMSNKVEKQTDKVALQELTSGGRKKFSVNNEGDDDV